MTGFIDTFFVQFLLITINYTSSQSNFSRKLFPWLPRTRSILVLGLRLTSESESYIMTDGQSASLFGNIASIWGLRPDLYYCQTVAGLLMLGALSDERTGLPFTVAAGPRQRSHFRVRVPWDHILLSQIRDFPFRRLLRLAGLLWRYSTPPPHGILNSDLLLDYLYSLEADS
jgi:hypothetical protein